MLKKMFLGHSGNFTSGINHVVNETDKVVMIKDNFLFSIQILWKVIPKLSSNTHLTCFTVQYTSGLLKEAKVLAILVFVLMPSCWGIYLGRVRQICVFEHSVMSNFNCACPAIQRGQGSGFLSEGSS